MQYCTHCGSVLNEGTIFCSGCGKKVNLPSGDGKKPSKKKSDSIKMDKGVVKSLKNEASNFMKSKIKKTITLNSNTSRPSKKLQTSHKVSQTKSQTEISKKPKYAKKLMIYYFLLNIPLYFINTGDDEIIGVLFFSAILLISYLIRMKKEKPFNIILKIIMGLQLLLMFATVMINLESLGTSISSVIAVITLLFLIFITGKLLFKGNKTI